MGSRLEFCSYISRHLWAFPPPGMKFNSWETPKKNAPGGFGVPMRHVKTNLFPWRYTSRQASGPKLRSGLGWANPNKTCIRQDQVYVKIHSHCPIATPADPPSDYI